jgi:hypothetical protein
VPGALVVDELIGAKQLLALVFGDEPAFVVVTSRGLRGLSTSLAKADANTGQNL